MNTKNLLIAALVGGLVSTALSNIPILNFVNCLLCAGFWGGPLFAVWMYKYNTKSMTLGQGVVVGILAGVAAGIFGFLLSFVGLAGFSAMMAAYQRFLPPDATKGMQDFMVLGPMAILFNLIGVGVNILFGAIGGLIGGAIFKTSPAPAE